MSTDTQQAAPTGRPRLPRLLPRFPAHWIIGSADSERLFGRLLWIQVPLQYYVATHVLHGLAVDDLLSGLLLSLMSVVGIFVLSWIAAWIAIAVHKESNAQDLTGRVRMWVVAVMIVTAGAYLLLVLSFLAAHAANGWGFRMYGDFITDRLTVAMEALAFSKEVQRAVPILVNVVVSLLPLVVVRLVYRAFGSPALRANEQDPDMLSVWVIVTAIMTATNAVGSLD